MKQHKRDVCLKEKVSIFCLAFLFKKSLIFEKYVIWSCKANMPSIEINENQSLFYEEYGEGLPIIFIHPPGMGRKVFVYQKDISNNMRVILPDLSGHGESVTVEQRVTISFYVNEVIRFMDLLNLKKAIICGYSAGCLIAEEIGLYFPERVLLMILVGSYPRVDTFSGKTLHKMGMYMVKKHKNFLIQTIARSHTKDKAVQQMLAQHMEKANSQVWYHYYLDSFKFNCMEKLDSLNMPLLFMYGEEGDWTSRYLKDYKRKCSHAEFYLFKDEGHQLPTKQWKTFNEQITRFVLKHTCTKVEL